MRPDSRIKSNSAADFNSTDISVYDSYAPAETEAIAASSRSVITGIFIQSR